MGLKNISRLPVGADYEVYQARAVIGVSPSFRDKGWMRGKVGGLVLVRVTRSMTPPNQDKHKAPSSTPLLPLSLQRGCDRCSFLPLLLGNNHYRPGERIDGALADKSAMRQSIVRLRDYRSWSARGPCRTSRVKA